MNIPVSWKIKTSLPNENSWFVAQCKFEQGNKENKKGNT